MTTRQPAPIREFHKPGRSFRRSFRKLPQAMKQELGVVIDELCAGNLSSGRRYEKLASTDNLYSVRLSRAYRFVFLLDPDSGTAWPVAVGPHDEAYSRALTRLRRHRH